MWFRWELGGLDGSYSSHFFSLESNSNVETRFADNLQLTALLNDHNNSFIKQQAVGCMAHFTELISEWTESHKLASKQTCLG